MRQRNPATTGAGIDGLDRLSRTALRALWVQEVGEKPPLSIGRDILALGIAYARQDRSQRGMAKRLMKDVDRVLERALVADPTGGVSAVMPALLRTGTILVREWRGATHHVTIVDDGFIWNGHTHRSLSSIAQAITGTKWNGRRFFGTREIDSRPPVNRHGA